MRSLWPTTTVEELKLPGRSLLLGKVLHSLGNAEHGDRCVVDSRVNQTWNIRGYLGSFSGQRQLT